MTAQPARAFLSDVGALSVLQLLQRLPALILFPIISKTLGPAAYGLWTQFFVMGELLGIFCDLALDDALVRFVPGLSGRRDQQEYFYSLTLTALGVSVFPAVALLLWPGTGAAALFGGGEQAALASLLGVYVMMEALDNLTLNMLRALSRIKLYVYLEASQVVVRTIVVALALLAQRDLWLAVQSHVVVQGVWLFIEVGLVIALVGARWPNFSHLRACLNYSLPLVPTRYSSAVLNYSDRLVIAAVLGPAAVGVYAASYDLALLIWQLVNPVRVALFPTVSRLWDEGNREAARWYLSQALKYISAVGIPAVVGLSALAPHLILWLSTPEFVEASRWVVPLAAGGILLNGLSIVFTLLLRLHKDTRAIAFGLLLSAALHLALNFALIPAIGIVGGAVGTLAGYGLDLGLVFWFAWRQSRFPLPVRPLIVFALASAVMTPAVVWLSRGGAWYGVLGSAALGAALYAIIVLSLRGITLAEIRAVASRSSL